MGYNFTNYLTNYCQICLTKKYTDLHSMLNQLNFLKAKGKLALMDFIHRNLDLTQGKLRYWTR